MYHQYETKAFVLGNSPHGEASLSFTLLTEEFGLIRAVATSVRAEKSKLRYGLQDFSYSEVVLVRGKESWRITNASLIENAHRLFRSRPDTVLFFSRLFKLLKRLLHGEEKNPLLFGTVRDALFRLKEDIPPSTALVEIIAVLRILYCLGYLAPREDFMPFLSAGDCFGESELEKASRLRAVAVLSINKSLSESHL